MGPTHLMVRGFISTIWVSTSLEQKKKVKTNIFKGYKSISFRNTFNSGKEVFIQKFLATT
jgi:hypothetical protein